MHDKECCSAADIREELKYLGNRRGELENRRMALEQRLYELEDLPRLRELVGKFYKFDNTAEHHATPRWAYLHVTGVEPKGRPGSGQHVLFVDRVNVYEDDESSIAEVQRNVPYFKCLLEHPSCLYEWQDALSRVRVTVEEVARAAEEEEER